MTSNTRNGRNNATLGNITDADVFQFLYNNTLNNQNGRTYSRIVEDSDSDDDHDHDHAENKKNTDQDVFSIRTKCFIRNREDSFYLTKEDLATNRKNRSIFTSNIFDETDDKSDDLTFNVRNETDKNIENAGIFDSSFQLFIEEKCSYRENEKSKEYSDESGVWSGDLSSLTEEISICAKDSYQKLLEKMHDLIEKLNTCNSNQEKCIIIKELINCCTEKSFVSISGEIIPDILYSIIDVDLDCNLSLHYSVLLYVISKEAVIPKNTSFLNIIKELIEMEQLTSFEKLQFNKDIKDNLKIQHLVIEEERDAVNHYSVCDFALGSLLNFINNTPDDTYKKRLRHLGGLDLIVDVVYSQCKILWIEDLSSSIQIYNANKLGKCLNILQNVIFKNPENQTHILNYRNMILLSIIVRILHFYRRKLSLRNFCKVPAKIYLSCLSNILKLLINITHKNAISSAAIGDYGEVMDILLYYIFSLPILQKEFEIMFLLFGFLTNLIMGSKENLYRLVDAVVMVRIDDFHNDVNALEALTEMFVTTFEESQRLEIITERLLYACAVESPSKSFDENASRVFRSADYHMEQSMICAQIALVLGYAIEDNPENISIIKKKLPSQSFYDMANVLREFHEFVRITKLLEDSDLKNIQRIENILSSL